MICTTQECVFMTRLASGYSGKFWFPTGVQFGRSLNQNHVNLHSFYNDNLKCLCLGSFRHWMWYIFKIAISLHNRCVHVRVSRSISKKKMVLWKKPRSECGTGSLNIARQSDRWEGRTARVRVEDIDRDLGNKLHTKTIEWIRLSGAYTAS